VGVNRGLYSSSSRFVYEVGDTTSVVSSVYTSDRRNPPQSRKDVEKKSKSCRCREEQNLSAAAGMGWLNGCRPSLDCGRRKALAHLTEWWPQRSGKDKKAKLETAGLFRSTQPGLSTP
jgi:hypothetical protein